jgi:Ca2+/Na+ antiporter
MSSWAHRWTVEEFHHHRPSYTRETYMLLILAIVLLIIAIAGGVIVHPVLFALAIVALVLFFSGRSATV